MNKNTLGSPPNPGSTGRSLLDWPFHAGIVDDAIAKLELKVQQRKRRRRRVASTTVAAVVIGLGLLWGVPFVRDTSTLTTASSHRETLALADGSQVDLNARTAVSTDFRYGRRTVRLDRGEAFFSVAKDAQHPFLVETPAGTVRVTGTKFNVRIGAQGLAQVTLLEGAVTATPAANSPAIGQKISEPAYLTPGQQLNLGAGTAVRALSPTQLENVVTWRRGRLALDGMTLAEAAQRFADYHGVAITVAPEVGGFLPGGSCSLDDLNMFLSLMQDALPVRVSASNGSYQIGKW